MEAVSNIANPEKKAGTQPPVDLNAKTIALILIWSDKQHTCAMLIYVSSVGRWLDRHFSEQRILIQHHAKTAGLMHGRPPHY